MKPPTDMTNASLTVDPSRRRTKGAAIITPRNNSNNKSKNAASSSSMDTRFTVDQGIVDELLLVCGVIGTTTSDDQSTLVPVTDCLNWLQDLQRALRRDDDNYRPISLLIGKWNVVQQKLLPLVMSCRYDTPIVLTIVKILVILTKPLSETTRRAASMVIDTKSGKVPDIVVKQQIKLRENALAQSHMLMEYKRAITHHSSHHGSLAEKSKQPDDGNNNGGLLSIFVSLLAEPLSKTGTGRSDADHLTIELVLHLLRNLLSAEPILKVSSVAAQQSTQLHQELIALLDRELVLEIILVVGQEMELRENSPYNLLMMEILHNLLRSQDPSAVARSIHAQRDKNNLAASSMDKAQPVKKVGVPVGTATVGALRTQLKKEKQKLHGALTSRHSNFGGTLVVNRPDGKRQIQSAALVERLGTASASSSQVIQRKNRKTEPFVASNSSLASHTRRAVASTDAMGPAAQEAQRTLHGFCKRFLQKCYGPVMKSLKNEFRRDSARLESDDQAIFFRIVWFFSQWWRVSGAGGRRNHLDKSVESEAVEKGQDVSNGELGQLIFTMDIFTFNLVLNATDTFFQHKQHSQLAQAVALYCEMMHLLYRMYQSKETTEQIMALGLMDRLFYASESLDRLPKLLSKWSPSTNTRDYLCDVVELCHVTLKLLESNSKEALDGAQKDSKEKADAVARMKENAADFDVTSYLSRKIISAHVVAAYTYLLSHYSTNAAHVNHHIIAFFLRLSKFKIATNQDDAERDEMGIPKNLLATKTVTLEPMLYNIKLIMVLNTILNDATIRHDPEFGFLLTFAASFMHNFCQSCQSNPLLYVECLFRHVVPHRFCDWSTNHYVSEELRMIAERELLLEETRRFEGQEEPNDDVSNEEGDEDEPELEFLDDENGAIVAAPRQLAIHSPVAESSIKGNNEEDEEPHDGVSNEEGGEDEPELEFFDDENGAIAAAPRQHANHSPVSENSIKSKSNNEENDDLSRSRLLLEGNTICKKRLVNDNLAVENDVLRKPKKLARVIEDSSDDEEPN